MAGAGGVLHLPVSVGGGEQLVLGPVGLLPRHLVSSSLRSLSVKDGQSRRVDVMLC